MSTLAKLQSASTLKDVAEILGYQPKMLSFLLYVLEPGSKYTVFSIPKKSGGTRNICAPDERLKTLQKHLANALYDCTRQIDEARAQHAAYMGSRRLPRSLSHGFKKNHSIVTNALPHKGRRYVLNLDIADFFPSFNFGRVRGFFIKNRNFGLHEKVATVIAQIACHQNELPQGSPSSPIISDLLTHILDVRLAGLAKSVGCTYSRYADDLTFSTNQKEFPPDIAIEADQGQWALSSGLVSTIQREGFRINSAKTRMQSMYQRQLVTGLTVNRKVNVQAPYYALVRAMSHQLFSSGYYYDVPGEAIGPPVPIRDVRKLEGKLNFVFKIKDRFDERDVSAKKHEPTQVGKLYRDFLNFKSFIEPLKPVIVCEGKTDVIYLRSAIRSLPEYRGKFMIEANGRTESTVRFFKYTKLTRDLMLLGGGTGDLATFVREYQEILGRFPNRRPVQPVILMVDNDAGSAAIFGVTRGKYKSPASLTSQDPFYRIVGNLYLVKTPEGQGQSYSRIEDLFDLSVRSRTVDGKGFDLDKDHGDNTSYGKMEFAEKIVVAQRDSIDFSAFSPLLGRLAAAIDDFHRQAPGS